MGLESRTPAKNLIRLRCTWGTFSQTVAYQLVMGLESRTPAYILTRVRCTWGTFGQTVADQPVMGLKSRTPAEKILFAQDVVLCQHPILLLNIS